jgi:hypothetical protein
MARRESTFVATEGRDQGKVFRIREMPASQAEAWASRLIIALFRGNADVPSGFFEQGWQTIAAIGLRGLGGLNWTEAKPLLDEMMACVSIQPDPNRPQVVRGMVEDDIEELKTRLELREAWMDLHLGFSMRARILNSIVDSPSDQSGPGPNIATFPAQSAR